MKFDSVSLPQTNSPQDGQKTALDLLNKTNQVAQFATSEASAAQAAAQAASVPVGKVTHGSYTPTFTNFGVCTNVAFSWNLIDNLMTVFGFFTVGAAVAAPGTFSLPNGKVVDPALWNTTGAGQPCGVYIYSGVGALSLYPLGFSNNGNISIGQQAAASSAFAQVNGNVFTGVNLAVFLSAPVK
jgi:hypothetical protein